MQKRCAKEIYLQRTVDQKFRSPLCNVSSHAHLWVCPSFNTCLRFDCDLLNKLPHDNQLCFTK